MFSFCSDRVELLRVLAAQATTSPRSNRRGKTMPRLRKPPLSEEVSDTSKPSGNGSSVPRDAKGRVQEGAVLNPRGRTPGSKDAISRAFVEDLHEAWLKHGKKVLDWLARKD